MYSFMVFPLSSQADQVAASLQVEPDDHIAHPAVQAQWPCPAGLWPDAQHRRTSFRSVFPKPSMNPAYEYFLPRHLALISDPQATAESNAVPSKITNHPHEAVTSTSGATCMRGNARSPPPAHGPLGAGWTVPLANRAPVGMQDAASQPLLRGCGVEKMGSCRQSMHSTWAQSQGEEQGNFLLVKGCEGDAGLHTRKKLVAGCSLGVERDCCSSKRGGVTFDGRRGSRASDCTSFTLRGSESVDSQQEQVDHEPGASPISARLCQLTGSTNWWPDVALDRASLSHAASSACAVGSMPSHVHDTDGVPELREERMKRLQSQLEKFQDGDVFLGRFTMLGREHRRRGGTTSTRGNA